MLQVNLKAFIKKHIDCEEESKGNFVKNTLEVQ